MRGLANVCKRKELFNYYRNGPDVICLQETHICEQEQSRVELEWGGKAFWSAGGSNSRGVAILFKPSLMVTINETKCSNDGRSIIVQFELQNKQYVLVNVYAPNADSPQFFQQISEMLAKCDGHKIITGDFNTVLDVTKDRVCAKRVVSKNNDNASEVIRNMIDEFVLEDVWRVRNPDTKTFTWSRSKPFFTASRIDYFLTEVGMASWIKKVKIAVGYKSDHRSVSIQIEPFEKNRGKGVWKINNTILTNIQYIHKINEVIESAKTWTQNLNRRDAWESIKMVIAAETQEFCIKLAAEKTYTKTCLESAITKLEDQLNETSTAVDHELLSKSKNDLENLIQESTIGTIFRSKVKWYNEGEKCSKYFLNLEKARANSKGMSILIDENNVEIYNPREIIAQQVQFYEQLYTSDPRVKFEWDRPDLVPKISLQQAEAMEGEITRKEIQEAIKQMARNKTPGADGLSIEWYIVFWDKIGEIVLDAINEGYRHESLHNTASEGLITLIPKKNKDTRYVRNMRPITLLNVDYKLIEKVLANRIKVVLPDIIHSNQKGFMSNRHVGINIRKIFEIVQYAEENDYEGVVISVDFEKAFDRCEIESVIGAAKLFGIPDSYLRWLKTVYNGSRSRITNKGFLSNFFPVTRSVKQGGPNSAFLFILIAELFAISIRNNKKIVGFAVNDILDVLNQFADDTDLFLQGDKNSIRAAMQTIESFHQISGMKVNYDKTTIYRIGSLRDSKAELYTEHKVNWENDTINVLGVDVAHSQVLERNYTQLIQKVSNITKCWSRRNLSLCGKITIVNSLIGSLFVYKMTVLPTMPETIINKLNKIIENFLWNGRKPKIKLTTLQANYEQGGLKLVNLALKDKSLKAKWVQLISQDPYLRELGFKKLDPPASREPLPMQYQCFRH